MNHWTEITTGGLTVGGAAAIWRFLRSEAGRTVLSRLRGSVVREAASLKEAIENLARVVEAQGHSIEWLRSELDATRNALEEARSALNDKENWLQQENEQLRTRVAELEAQVKALESALSRRIRAPKKSTTTGRKK